MIPRKLHYCWFGGKPFPKSVEKCIVSWQKVCPDFEIVRWDETNAPLDDNLYTRQAYQMKKWAFVSDYVRLKALSEQGGVYLDTDVELVQSLEPFLQNQAFFGFESTQKIATCMIGAIPHHPIIDEFLSVYRDRTFLEANRKRDETTNVVYITELLLKYGLELDGAKQQIGDIAVYPIEYFSPKDLETGEIHMTENTVAIHHFQASWMSRRQIFHTKIAQLLGPEYTRKVKQLLRRDL